jgi:hypothetical protein
MTPFYPEGLHHDTHTLDKRSGRLDAFNLHSHEQFPVELGGSVQISLKNTQILDNTAYATHLPILLLNLGMLSTQDLGAKLASILRRDGPGISLSPDLVDC